MTAKSDLLIEELVSAAVAFGREKEPDWQTRIQNARSELKAYVGELEAERRWVPVSEPPKVSGKYLLLNIYDDVYPCDFIAGTEIWVLPDYDTITHWMPLPKLPEVQE